MNKQHIAASQRLSEIFTKTAIERKISINTTIRLAQCTYTDGTDKWMICEKLSDFETKSALSLPWLKIDSQSEWCSFKFLCRCGWQAKSQTLLGWIIEVGRLPTKRSSEKEISTHVLIVTALDAGDLELAFILAIILIHEIAPELYKLGVEPLMGE